MHLFTGSSHQNLAEHLARELHVPLGKVALRTFSCGERYVRFEESIRGNAVYLLQTGSRTPNEDIMELLLLCQAAKLSFAASVHVIIPHFPYARQDRITEPREPISAKLIAHLLEESGADHVITLDLHSDQIQGFFQIPVDAIHARTIFAEYFRTKNLPFPVVISPDVGGAKRAKKFADSLSAPLAILHKNRPGTSQADVHHVVGDVAGKTCILFDDIIDTAGTLFAARTALLRHGANPDIYAAATHAVLSGDAPKRLREADFKEIVVTDSIPPPSSQPENLTFLSIAPLLAEVIRHIESHQSVTEIYGQ
ncbi:hypothetical protein A3H22_00250 [Candidatus Peribacteria bacterium RIFCSPLOWO2_12_FULL_55_15]|nr:MAG: hypothetical protein A2789_02355 [Candidatus Peribacteria bacterium RIFCSPHIGHO2_01_FULL_54_22]OGJ63345.1 MAG: hypothetical protein A3D12_00230 [Candidatus Peribacteria bacterium RIFCSPHIGHO2_02_FULL_55_24]OGJ69752.1 MAG: hypothetical protein A3H90_01655 [Candidatus Peribacteria bacterium RIFCSPLOWO2_02_FULL_55_36]OGJ70325.1 MAG: hypothetical protein A3H22_00250 [Candidatus Peribacteria bacterium RIFCSPLOWO2_12_FULL_55_15]